MIKAANLRKNGGYYRCDRTGMYLSESKMDVDHIIPKEKGGKNTFSNAQFVHQSWNRSKKHKFNGRKKKRR
jgi:5-methylcytosine-specific restriction endonuclease McrA